MTTGPLLLLVLDLIGTFVFALNGALTAVHTTRLDVVGVLTLGMVTALGGGVIRDVLIGSIPPATFRDWRYLAMAVGGGLVAFALSKRLGRLETPIVVLDAVGLSVFAVIGASKAMEFGLDIGPAIILGAVTGVGGGTIRDTLLRQIPTVLHSDLYAIPALVGAAITVGAIRAGVYGIAATTAAAAACFVIRMLGVRFGLNAPVPPGTKGTGPGGTVRRANRPAGERGDDKTGSSQSLPYLRVVHCVGTYGASAVVRRSMRTVADFVADTLLASGVRRIYGIPGDSLNAFTDALRRRDEFTWVHVRHEEAAAFAAAGEAQLTDELAVCAGSCGPGNLHLINGLYDAQRSRVPVLAIAAQIPSQEIGSNYFQETHPRDLFKECSVFVEHVAHADQMPRLLRIAMREALSKRGVAVLVIPGDVALAKLDAEPERTVATRAQIVPHADELAAAARALNAGSKVTILAGAGCQGALEELVELAGTLQAPVVHSLRGKEFVEHDNPYDVGMTGLLGFSSGYRAMEHCDTLVMLGTDFPYQQFLPGDATVIQVDLRGSQLGRRTKVDFGLVGGVRETVRALLPLLEPKSSGKHLDTMVKHYARTRKDLDELATPSRRSARIHPQYLARLIDEAAEEDAVFVPDVGSPVVWAARYLRMNGRRRMIGSFNHGSMANALPQSIGAQATFPTRQVVALAGDGGLTMLMGELVTLIQMRLPVKVVVFNNSSLNFVELEMKAAGIVAFGTDLVNPDFAKVGDALGVKGWRVEESEELPKAVEEFLAHDGPAILDVVTDRQELSIPPAVSFEQAKGFALFAVRTVLSGRGTELLDLARTNLRQF